MDRIFNELTNSSQCSLFNATEYIGLEIKWVRKGVGFGQILFFYDSTKKTWDSDTEQCSQELLAEILAQAAPELAKLMISIDESRKK